MNTWMSILFLYFPEDKSEYIPAAISFFIFAIVCILTFKWIVNKSKKQEEQTKELEERILHERRLEAEKKSNN
jgi:large-conductance mechanosensitive channel